MDLRTAFPVLERTPQVLDNLLGGLPEDLTHADEGPDTWSAFDVMGHLIHGEKTDWIPRARIILEHEESRPFESFDRFAQFEASKGHSLQDLLAEFTTLRTQNLKALRELSLEDGDLQRKGTHPELGTVTLSELLATWVVHDLGHIAQISRVMAKQLKNDVGAWQAYIPVLGMTRSKS